MMRGGAWWILLVAAAAGLGKGGGGDLPPAPARSDAPLMPGWLSFDDIVRLGIEAGFAPQTAYKMARVAWRESMGNPAATRIVTAAQAPALHQLPERSFGLWQINTVDERGRPKRFDEELLLDPRYNAQAAFELSRGGANLAPWNLR